jgi:hypothetical protein
MIGGPHLPCSWVQARSRGNVKRSALGELLSFQVLEWKLRMQRQAFHHARAVHSKVKQHLLTLHCMQLPVEPNEILSLAKALSKRAQKQINFSLCEHWQVLFRRKIRLNPPQQGRVRRGREVRSSRVKNRGDTYDDRRRVV